MPFVSGTENLKKEREREEAKKQDREREKDKLEQLGTFIYKNSFTEGN